MKIVALAACALLAPAAAGAQQQPATAPAAATPAAAASAATPTDPADAVLVALRQQWQDVTANITKAAEEFPAAAYAYKPVATVRSVGQMIGHVAGAQYMICASALGDPPRAEDAVEKAATTKAALLQALRESTEYCARAYAQSPAVAAGAAQLFGRPSTRMNALALNAIHNGEHYGNLVTYMRMKGMVPPSSRR